jgi:hypothetical protein
VSAWLGLFKIIVWVGVGIIVLGGVGYLVGGWFVACIGGGLGALSVAHGLRQALADHRARERSVMPKE